jgi:hypothetical protein
VHAKGGPRSHVCTCKNPKFHPPPLFYPKTQKSSEIFSIKLLPISPLFIFIKKNYPQWGGFPKKCFCHLSSIFTLISTHTNFHNPRPTPSGRKVREAERERDVCHAACLQRRTGSTCTSLGPTLLIEATSFATQPICNKTLAAHALRSD